MILSGSLIKHKLGLGEVVIQPFVPEHIGPNSYDLTLASKLLVYSSEKLDAAKPNPTREIMIGDDGFEFQPNILYLAHTNESAGSDYFVPMIEGRSSLARLGVMIHQTGGFGDVGFKRQWTLEITVTHPIRLYSNMRIAQIYFMSINGDFKLYNGKYVNSHGVEASKIYQDSIFSG